MPGYRAQAPYHQHTIVSPLHLGFFRKESFLGTPDGDGKKLWPTGGKEVTKGRVGVQKPQEN